MLQLAGVQTGDKVLEPGCGTGRLTEILARRVGPEGRVIATEISGTMLRLARNRLTKWSTLSFHQGPAETMPLAGASLDHVVCHQVLPHFDDLPAAIENLSHGLRPCGTFVVSHLQPASWINDVHRKAGSVVAKDQLPGLSELRTLLRRNGLGIETFQDRTGTGYLLVARKKEAAGEGSSPAA
ncbi:MAG: methyltransferase domain-containing protein [Verrucomicrobia bacterium]|nr:methyltransferase domain-containing protein [Verrucomicrobiota bacterium]